jgi:hypothetical protein
VGKKEIFVLKTEQGMLRDWNVMIERTPWIGRAFQCEQDSSYKLRPRQADVIGTAWPHLPYDFS